MGTLKSLPPFVSFSIIEHMCPQFDHIEGLLSEGKNIIFLLNISNNNNFRDINLTFKELVCFAVIYK